jgi:succinate dehydrogenase/fumarate reductase cytochrome b subunit
MTTRTISGAQKPASLTTRRWFRIGLQAATGSILAVLLTQTVILAIAPELAAFKPLDNFARSALFTGIPAIIATAVFAWLVKTKDQPVAKFLWIAAGFLLLSFIPDYLLPIPNRTLVASTAAAFLHLVAGIVTVSLILASYARSARGSRSS